MGVNRVRAQQPAGSGQGAERGSATVEFLASTLLLLVPIVYLILTFSAVQAATYAAESAARESSRIYSRATAEHAALSQAQAATYFAFNDHNIHISPSEVLRVTCEASPCLTAGAGVHIRVSIDVALPLLPDFLSSRVPTSVAVSAESLTTVDRFGGGGQ